MSTFIFHLISVGGEFGSISRVIGGTEKFCLRCSSFCVVLIARLKQKIRRHFFNLLAGNLGP